MKSVKPIFFHGTKQENIEKILDSGFLKTTYGCYGEGVYCASTIKTALEESYGNAVLGIQVYGLEKYMVMPINKIFEWGIFTKDVPINFIKYIVIFDESREQISIDKDKNGLLWIYSSQPNEIYLPYCCTEITNIIFRELNKQHLPKVRLNKIKVTKPYTTKVDETIPSLEEFLCNRREEFSSRLQDKNIGYSYQGSFGL